MSEPIRNLTFAWWNVRDFAHYDETRLSDPRWPKQPPDYEAKRNRILDALNQIFGDDFPDLLGICEITREAARDIAKLLPGDFHVTVSPGYPHDDGFQVAVFYRSNAGFSSEIPLFPTDHEDVAIGTRPMIPVHFTIKGHVIRFIACHWTAMDEPSSQEARQRTADVLRRNTHDFLKADVPSPGVIRHIVVFGDLNEEPTSEIFERRLIGRRDHESPRTNHSTDPPRSANSIV